LYIGSRIVAVAFAATDAVAAAAALFGVVPLLVFFRAAAAPAAVLFVCRSSPVAPASPSK
jgi:hypothetical protein